MLEKWKEFFSFFFLAEFWKMVYDNEASILRGKESLPALEHSLLHRYEILIKQDAKV